MNQSGRMEKVREALERHQRNTGVSAAAALAEVEEWETRLLNLETQGIADALGFRDTEMENAVARADAAEAEADRLKAALEALIEWADDKRGDDFGTVEWQQARAALVPADRNTT